MIRINFSARRPQLYISIFFLKIVKCSWKGKSSAVNFWEVITADSLSSSKASSEWDITSIPKALDNAVRLIICISKADNERCGLYRNMNKHRDITALQLCQSFSIICENQLRN